MGLARCIIWGGLLLAWSAAAQSPTPSADSTPVQIPPTFESVLHEPVPPIIPLAYPVGMLIDDFSQSPVGAFPLHWRAKGNNGKHFYTVAEEDGVRYLKVEAIEDGTSIFREWKWDVQRYPILEWKWRGRLLPKNGNEGRQSTNDCTVALYVIFPIRWMVPDSLKYSWSTTLPVATELSNGFRGTNKTRVLRSGEEQLGQWVVERRNVLEDYRRRFDREPKTPMGIGVITDADNTRSRSHGDYAYFKVLTLEEAAELPLTP